MNSTLKKIGIAIALLFVIIQFIPVQKNENGSTAAAIGTRYPIPPTVESTLKVTCYDCHSNHTRYPWYAQVQPLGWWLQNHVKEGKHELNFDEFLNLPVAVQHHKLEESIEMIEEGEMPLWSYTLTHHDAKLSEPQKQALIAWAKSVMDTLKATYPADSLMLRRKKD